MVYHLKGAQPKIIEYRVGPIKIDNTSWPLTSEHIAQEGDAIDYRMRPVSQGEYDRMETLVNDIMRMLINLTSVLISFNLLSQLHHSEALNGCDIAGIVRADLRRWIDVVDRRCTARVQQVHPTNVDMVHVER